MLKCSDCKMVYCHASCAAKVMTDEDDAWVCKACVIRQRRAAKDKKQKRKKEKHVYCQIEEFHIDCVGLKTRRRNWYVVFEREARVFLIILSLEHHCNCSLVSLKTQEL